MNAQQFLDWQKLHDWATAKEPDSEIGRTCAEDSCPVANYLHQQTGELWRVGLSIFLVDDTDCRLDKPLWIDALLENVDALATALHTPVTREQFLRVLQDIKPVHDEAKKKDTSPMVQTRRIKRQIRIQEENIPPSSLFDVTVAYPSDELPEWFAPLQPIVEDETFTDMRINLGGKVKYHITLVEGEK